MGLAFLEMAATQALAQAREFFGTSAEVETYIIWEAQEGAGPNIAASVELPPGYLFAMIYLPVGQQRSGRNTWANVAHEVAHLEAREALDLCGDLPKPYGKQLSRALESLTVRLERTFLRHRPYPGDEWVEALLTTAQEAQEGPSKEAPAQVITDESAGALAGSTEQSEGASE